MTTATRLAATFSTVAAALLALATPAFAAQPTPWAVGFQDSASVVMEHIQWFETFTLIIITAIVVFVLALMVYVCWRFSEKNNRTPSKTTHNAMLEVAWTVVPIIILVVIAVPSFRLLYEEAVVPPADMTIKATGYQWYWGYEYQTEGEVSFDSLMLQESDRADYGKEDVAAYPRLLAVDNEFVVPVGKTVRLLVTAADVLHAFAMPAFGVKMDAVPGRLNETWFKAEAEGMYYGQCSELCGKDHAYMPIAIRVVSQEQFDAWLAAAADDVEAANRNLVAAIEADAKSVDVAANEQN